MWGGGFWGTPREEAWRRRKEKEHALESRIRNEEQVSHEQEMQSKEHVLDLTRSLLQQSRVEETRIKRSASDSGNGGRSEEEEDRKPSARKKPRSLEQNVVDAQDPDEVLSSEAFRVKEEEKDDDNDDDEDPTKSLDSIRENLLGLSYAMYDSLIGTTSFEAKPFCEFLIKTGERSLAEQIALAAVEKSNGSENDVHYILFNLVAESGDADGLVERVTKILGGCNPQASEAGRRVLVQWQVKNGDRDAAFQFALQFSDEEKRFETAYPLLDGKAERRQKLKEACSFLCATRKIFPFSEEEWPDFVAFYISQPKKIHYAYGRISVSVYLDFAVTKMKRQRGREIAQIVLKDSVGKNIEQANYVWTTKSGPSAFKKCDNLNTVLKKSRSDATKEVSEHLNSLNTALFGNQETTQTLETTLGINLENILLDAVESHVELSPPPSACKTAHRDAIFSFKCRACKEQMFAAAWQIGLLLAIRQHSTIKDEPRIKALGGDTLRSPEKLKAELRKSGIHKNAVDILVADAAPLFEK